MNVSLLQSIAHLPGVLIENKNGFRLNHAKLNCVSSFQPKCVFLFRKIKKEVNMRIIHTLINIFVIVIL